MNLFIFNSILNGELKPWLVDIKEETLKEIVWQSNKMPVNDLCHVAIKLRHLLQPFQNLRKSITIPTIQEIKHQSFLSKNIEATTLFQHYYKALIDTATIFYYNEVINNPFLINKALDVPFQIGVKSLNGISILCNQANNELIESDFENKPQLNGITHFAYTYLRNNLLALYFSIQSEFKEYLTHVYDTVDDYYLYKMDSDLDKIKLEIYNNNQEIISIAKSDNKPFNFGFKGNERNLKNLILILCNHKNLLNEQITKQNDLIELLTTSDIQNKVYKIHFGCNTNLVAYILESLKRSIPKLTNANIDRCGYFFTERGTPISQALLSNSKSNNTLPKKTKAEIDKIFKENEI